MNLMWNILLLLFFISCSHQVARSPGSAFLCEDAYKIQKNNRISDEQKLVDKFFLKAPKTVNHVNYHLNTERVERYILNLSFRFRNELSVSKFGHYDGHDLLRINIPGWGKGKKKKVIITAGVHGNESAGVVTAINVLERFIYDPTIRNHFDIVFVPLMNPGGLNANTRRILNGTDLNRTFPGGKSPKQKLTTLIRKEFENESFDLGLDLHEAPYRDKFFVIKMDEDDKQLTKMVLKDIPEEYLITARDGVYPGNMYKANPPGTTATEEIPKNISYTLYAPGEVSSANRGTVKGFFADDLDVEYSYTIEGPGQFDLTHKIEIYSDIVENYFRNFLNY